MMKDVRGNEISARRDSLGIIETPFTFARSTRKTNGSQEKKVAAPLISLCYYAPSLI